MKKIIVSIFSLLLVNSVFSQQEIKLYPNGVSESNEIKVAESAQRTDFIINISEPRMYFYPAPKDKANGTAVLICPGGGYSGVSVINEGKLVAEMLNESGISAFVLYYRMPNGHTTIPLTDAQTALQIIFKHSKNWNIDKTKIGIMGFSAGGHLASTVGTHFKTKIQRPAFMILGYPVVTMQSELTHKGSRNNLLGNNPNEALVGEYSNELQVRKNTPPTFIFHASDDKAVSIKNSIHLYQALKREKIVCELDTFAVGGHGFGMKKTGIPADKWPELLIEWLKTNKFIKR